MLYRLSDVQAFLQEEFDTGERLGILKKTGDIRNGKPVYCMTEFGTKFFDAHEGEDFEAAVERLARAH